MSKKSVRRELVDISIIEATHAISALVTENDVDKRIDQTEILTFAIDNIINELYTVWAELRDAKHECKRLIALIDSAKVA